MLSSWLLVLLGVSCAERIGNYLCVSPAHRRRTAPGAAFAVSWNVFGEKIFAFSLLRRTAVVQIFSPPLRPFSRFSPPVTKICFALSLYPRF